MTTRGIHKKYFVVIVSTVLICIGNVAAYAAETVTLLLTSNLEGRFLPEIANQETKDPMFLMGQSILKESQNRKIYYFDLGNAFYPGILSKHNSGAAVMDFFSKFNCIATLLSSMDLRIGLGNLEFLQSISNMKLLSANILSDNKMKFNPFIIQKMGGKSIAFVGLSSKDNILVDVADRNIFKISIDDNKKVMERIISDLKIKGIQDIILLSGLDFDDNMTLLNSFNQIRLVITGGDNKGKFNGGSITRIDTSDGRSIIAMPPNMGYCLLDISIHDTVSLAGIQFKQPAHYPQNSDQYFNFVQRITEWKQLFASETNTVLAKNVKSVVIDRNRIASFLQDRYYAEIAIINNESVTAATAGNSISYQDILSAINSNYTLYTYRLTGDDLKSIADSLTDCTISGYKDGKISGCAVESDRKYLVVSPQDVYEQIRKSLDRKIQFHNTWQTISDTIVDDLKNEKVVLNSNFDYLNDRFHFVFNMSLCASFDTSKIIADKNVKIPVGEPNASYSKWGVEGTFNFIVYNRLHKLVITPYINYYRQGGDFLDNLIRGSVFYALNLHPIINPYDKVQVESNVQPTRGTTPPETISTFEDLRLLINYREMHWPIVLRETAGMNIMSKYVNGNIGAGFEKYVHDPVNPFVFGIEAQINFKYEFLTYLTYSLKLDSFISLIGLRGRNSKDNYYLRSELQNALSFKLTEGLNFSLKYRWYLYQYLNNNRRYSNSQVITSFDVKTDFKI